MLAYTSSRVIQALVVVLGAYLVTFVGIHLLPTDPITNYLLANEMAADQETIARMKAYYGFNKPIHEQFLVQLGGILRAELGYSLMSGRSVAGEIGDVIGHTLELAGTAVVFSVAIAFAIVTVAELGRPRFLRGVARSLPPLLGAMPSFWLGIVLIQLLSFRLRVMSVFPDGSWMSLLVPALVLGTYVSAPMAQVMLKGVDTARKQPFVEAVRAKGATTTWLYFRHQLKYAAGSGATALGLAIGGLLAGSVMTETVFSRPGIGRVLQSAVANQDIALVQGFVILIAALYVFVNLVVDMLYPLLDPRIVRNGGRTTNSHPV